MICMITTVNFYYYVSFQCNKIYYVLIYHILPSERNS